MTTNAAAPSANILSTLLTRLIPLLMPVLLLSILYLVVSVFVMPLRFQFKIPTTPIFTGNALSWFDVAIAYFLGIIPMLGSLRLAAHTGQVLGRSKWWILASVAITPTHSLLGKWMWQPYASVMRDAPSGGTNVRLGLPMFALIVLTGLFAHALIAALTTLVFSVPLWITGVLGIPATMPCIILDSIAHPTGLLRVKCESLQEFQWWDADAFYFGIVICAIWLFLDICLGLISIRQMHSEMDAFSDR